MSDLSGILDVCIGLVFVYLLLSLVCSSLVELVESLLKRRGLHLWDGLGELLLDDGAGTFRWKLYHHPLIFGLYRNTLGEQPKAELDNPQSPVQLENPGNLPSYIPPRTFALALMGLLTEEMSNDEVRTFKHVRDALAIQASPNIGGTRVIPQATAKALLLMLDSGTQDFEHAITAIGSWFDEMTSRVSGWYKRHAQKVALVVGFAIAFVGNFDTLEIGQKLWSEPAMRDAVVKAAEAFPGTSANADPKSAAATGTSATGQKFAPAQLCPGTLADEPNCQQLASRLGTLNNAMDQLGLPVGWHWSDVVVMKPADWLSKILGLLATGLAVSFGAPFWFDLLNKFMKLRSALRPESIGAKSTTDKT